MGKDAACVKRDHGQRPPPDDGPHNDNAPFDPKAWRAKAWRRKYMRKYMAARREREKAAKAPKD